METSDEPQGQADPRQSVVPPPLPPRGLGCGPIVVDYEKLSQGRQEVFVQFRGETYRLRLTRNQKLILTK